MTPDFERAAQVLADATEVALACHVNPDADASAGAQSANAGVASDRLLVPGEPLDPRWVVPGADRWSAREF
jgi:hypothetical protein